jgi:hypothetical protein
MRRLFTLLALLLAAPTVAQAQVYVVPPAPPVYVPPVYAPPPPPHVYIRERIRWHLRRAGIYVAPPVVVPPRVYVAPRVYAAPPAVYVPPPVYVQPRVYVAAPIPPPIVVPPPVYYVPCPEPTAQPSPPPQPAPEVVIVKPTTPPAWSSRIGLGVRGTGQIINDGWNNLGIGGEFLYRAGAHVSTELAAEYQHNATGNLDRMDVPVTLGVRLHIGKPTWVVSPYFVLAAGFDYADQDLKVTHDKAFYFDGQVGAGLEIRLGQHFAITADGRFDGKKRVNSPEDAVANTRSVDGKPVHALADEYGGQFRLGAAVYF